MRLDVTLPEARALALEGLALQLGLTKSQILDEALALFLVAVQEARKGRSFSSHDGVREREFVTPSLSQIQWGISQDGGLHGA